MGPLFELKRRSGGRSLRRWSGGLAGSVLLALLPLGPNPVSGQQAQVPQVDVVEPFTSVFIDNPSVGKDPFFPRSKRRVSKMPVPADGGLVVTEGLVLKGLSGTPDRRLAIVNNVTLAEGEEASLRIGQSTLKVRCTEIRDRSVILNINGLNRELRLRPDL